MMALPFLMSAKGLLTVGAAMSAASSIASGNAANRAGQRNGALLDAQADDTRRATVTRENLTRDRGARTLSDQRAALLANGVDPTSGTALIGSGQSAQDAEMDALTLRYEGLMQGRNQNMEADNARYQGKAAKRGGYLSAAGSLLMASGAYFGGTQLPAPVSTAIPVPTVFPQGML